MNQGEIGVLDRRDMDHFAGIFIAYQKLGKSKKPEGQSPNGMVSG